MSLLAEQVAAELAAEEIGVELVFPLSVSPFDVRPLHESVDAHRQARRDRGGRGAFRSRQRGVRRGRRRLPRQRLLPRTPHCGASRGRSRAHWRSSSRCCRAPPRCAPRAWSSSMSEPVVVLVPQINPNDEHAVVVRWHVAKGARVRAGQPLVTMETTKTTFDVDSPSDGYAYFEHEPNAELAVGAPVAWIARHGATAAAYRARTAAQTSAAPTGAPADRFTRKARKLMKEHGLAEADFPGDRTRRCRSRRARRSGARRALAAARTRTGRRRAARAVAGEDHRDSNAAPRARAGGVEHGGGRSCRATSSTQACARRREHGPVSLLELTVYEAARLLPEWPELNGFYADGRAWGYEHVAIGFAVNLGRSLRVPVVKEAARAHAARRRARGSRSDHALHARRARDRRRQWRHVHDHGSVRRRRRAFHPGAERAAVCDPRRCAQRATTARATSC